MLEHYKHIIHSDLFRKGPIVVFIWENVEHWPVEAVTTNIQKVLGYLEEDFLTHKIAYDKLIHPDDFETIVAEVNTILEDKKDFFEHTPYRVRKKDGSYIWVSDYTACIKSKGQITHLIGYIFDVSKEKNLLEALERSNDRWMFAIDGNGDGLWDWDVTSSHVYYSPQWKKILGYETKEIEDNLNEWSKRVHPDDITYAENSIKEYFSRKTEIYESKHRLMCKDGSYIWVLDRGMAIERDTDGTPTRMIGTHRDITKEKLLEDSFLEQKQELENIIAITKDGLALLDENTNFIKINNAYTQMTGYSQEELIGKSCTLMSIEEDISRTKAMIKRVLQEGFVENFEKTCIVKNGKKLKINMSVSLMPDKKTFLVSARDITEAKAVEKKMKDYIKIVDENIITSTTDIEGHITYASEAFCKISKYTQEELLGKKHSIIRHPNMPETLFKELWESILDGKTWKGEIQNLAKDGTTYWVDTTISPSYDDEKNLIGFTSIRQNITDRKRVEELSITDALTSIYNRLKLDSVLSYELNQSKRYKTDLSLIILDVDNFKSVNDNYGHQTGDLVLKEVSAILKDNSRVSDTLGRWGGEEFLIILPKTNLQEAVMVAEKLRIKIESFDFSIVGYKTCSFGVSTLQGPSDSEQKLVERADNALYRAKEGGKNRVES